jgi:hypothetical protein
MIDVYEAVCGMRGEMEALGEKPPVTLCRQNISM